MRCISIRPPWAWCIVCMPGPHWKDVENRLRTRNGEPVSPAGALYRGPLLIHASGTLTAEDYEAARTTAIAAGLHRSHVGFPTWAELERLRGCLLGAVRMFDVSPPGYELDDRPPSPWRHDDHYAFHLSDRVALPRRSFPGKLGLFDVEPTPAELALLRAAGLAA